MRILQENSKKFFVSDKANLESIRSGLDSFFGKGRFVPLSDRDRVQTKKWRDIPETRTGDSWVYKVGDYGDLELFTYDDWSSIFIDGPVANGDGFSLGYWDNDDGTPRMGKTEGNYVEFLGDKIVFSEDENYGKVTIIKKGDEFFIKSTYMLRKHALVSLA